MIVNGRLTFENLTSDPSSAVEGDLYYNSTDKKLKSYNGTSWDDIGGGVPLDWMFDASLYTVYEDWEGVGIGTFSGNSDWNLATAQEASFIGTPVREVVASTTSGGTGKELHIGVSCSNGSNGWYRIEVDSLTLPADKTGYWMRVTTQFYDQGAYAYPYIKWKINGTTYSYDYATYQSSINIIKNSGGTYDVYVGINKLLVSGLANITSIGFFVEAKTGSTGYSASSQIYVDDVRYLE